MNQTVSTTTRQPVSSTSQLSLDNVQFPADTRSAYRVKVSGNAEKFDVWVECKQSHEQWKSTLENVNQYGPGGGVQLPCGVVFSGLKTALAAVERTGGTKGVASDVATVDIRRGDNSTLIVQLVLSMSQLWSVQFNLPVGKVEMSSVELMSAQLRDAQDEIKHLKEALKSRVPVVCALSNEVGLPQKSVIAPPSFGSGAPFGHVPPKFGAQQINTPAERANDRIAWPTNKPPFLSRVLPPEHFALSDDDTMLTVLAAGVYEVDLRLYATDNSQPVELRMRSKGKETCVLQTSISTTDCNQSVYAVHVHETVSLKEGDQLYVNCHCAIASSGTQGYNRLTVRLFS